MTDEEQYFETRAEEWEHSRGLSRAQLLKLGAAVPLLAGASRLLSADIAGAARLADPPIRKPLPPEWFVPFGTNAEMRWDSRCRPRLHRRRTSASSSATTPSTPVIDPATWRLRVLRQRASRSNDGHLFHLHATTAKCYSFHHARPPPFYRVRRQRAQLLREASKERPASGTQWTLGAVGVAHWRGVLLVRSCWSSAGIKHQRRGRPPGGPRHERRHRAASTRGRIRRPLPVFEGAR